VNEMYCNKICERCYKWLAFKKQCRYWWEGKKECSKFMLTADSEEIFIDEYRLGGLLHVEDDEMEEEVV